MPAKHLVIQSGVSFHHSFDAELRRDPLAAGGSELPGERRIEQQPFGQLGEGHPIADGNEIAGLFGNHQLTIGRNVTGDDRQPGGHGFHDAVGKSFEIAGKPENVECRKESLRVVAVAKKLHALADFEPMAEVLKFLPFGPLSDHHKDDFAVHDADEFKRPDQIHDPLLTRQPSDKADDVAFGPNSELAADGFARARLANGKINAVMNDGELFGGDANIAVEIGDALRVSDEPRRSSDQLPIEPELPASLPRIDTSLGDDDGEGRLRAGGQPSVRICCKEPRLKDVGSAFFQKVSQTPPGDGVSLKAFIENGDGNSCCRELIGVRPRAGQSHYLHRKLGTGKPRRQQGQLLFGACPVESRYQQQEFDHASDRMRFIELGKAGLSALPFIRLATQNHERIAESTSRQSRLAARRSRVIRDLTMFANFNQSRLELVQGDITLQKVDAIVNAANSELAGGGGVDGAIHRAGGRILMQQTRVQYPEGCPTGHAVATDAGLLPARHVFHAVGPVWRGGNADESELLASAYRRCLELAVEYECASLAFPAISTGVYGYPKDLAAEVSLTTARDFLVHHLKPALVRFVLFDGGTFAAYARVLEVLRAHGMGLAD